jgi:hypothetical protein
MGVHSKLIISKTIILPTSMKISQERGNDREMEKDIY